MCETIQFLLYQVKQFHFRNVCLLLGIQNREKDKIAFFIKTIFIELIIIGF